MWTSLDRGGPLQYDDLFSSIEILGRQFDDDQLAVLSLLDDDIADAWSDGEHICHPHECLIFHSCAAVDGAKGI
jgi:hypothetical protein